MSSTVDEHRAQGPDAVAVAVLTVSDSRDADSDTSGRMIVDRMTAEGHEVRDHRIVQDEPELITAAIEEWVAGRRVDAIVVNGGTGISARDQTFETLSAIYQRRLDGFGELFRMLSYQEIGSAAMLSRSSAGVVNGIAIFSLPGSSNAVRLGLEKLIVPEITHIVFELRKQKSARVE
jgi:molybdopterin adenylyltransferase